MTAKPYAPQSWGDNEPMFMEKLNAMTNNDQYLFENMATVYYNAHGLRKANGTKMMAGLVTVPASTTVNSSSTFYFGSFFAAGCKPVVVASPISYPQGRLHVTVSGIGTLFPDHRGFFVRVASDEISQTTNKIRATVYVPFIAVGW